MQLSGILDRQELQTINRRFEARQWLNWSKESLKRLNPVALYNYHEQHEYPRNWLAWDYTLSWLLENNHPPKCNDIVIFNHTVEDEPQKEALAQEPWIKPLLQHPIPRSTIADMVDFLAKAGARMIILDNDFPQYSVEDRRLAQAIHDCATGKYGRKIPIFMVRAVNRRSAGPLLALEAPTSPVGVLDELSKLEPGVDVQAKYTGITSVDQDGDQVVRRIWTTLPGLGQDHQSLIIKGLMSIGHAIPKDVPTLMDIDFAAPPNSELYPVRPLHYLLDPEKQKLLLGQTESGDVKVKNAIVFIGDGITDVYSTPFTNEGENLMSGTEILANAMETVARHSWPGRAMSARGDMEHVGLSLLYLVAASAIGGVFWLLWKEAQNTALGKFMAKSISRFSRLTLDIGFYCLTLASTYIAACLIFAQSGLLVPIFVPSLALGLGTLAAIIWEREREKEDSFKLRLQAAQDKLYLEREWFESELARQQAEGQAREMLNDRKRRREFVRRINHDLNAPVSVLNWTIAELQMMDLQSAVANEKVVRLVKSSDKLGELIDQLVQSYDYETNPELSNNQSALCDLVGVLDDCVDGQKPLAEKHRDTITWERPDSRMWVKANSLELSRVIDNIIRNAIKHNPSETNVFVSLDSNGTFHSVLISDSGKGIAQEHLDHIFQPGYRVNPEKKDGQGLGLDIAKTLVESMGGEISVSSAVGKGTTFKLKLPICSDSRTSEEIFLMSVDPPQDATLTEYPVLDRRLLEATVKQGTGE
jgi:signal transduction histidine kinase